MGLRILHIYAGFLSVPCPALHRIAFPVVSEWCQEYPNYASPVPLQTGIAQGHEAPLRAAKHQAPWGHVGGIAYVTLSCSAPSLTPARISKTGRRPPRAPSVRNAPSRLVKPSPTPTLPKVVSATILAAVEAGTEISTPESPVSTLTRASRESAPPKSSS